jgi:prepilin-type N-terminal cleavage/methylation domain-containing protein
MRTRGFTLIEMMIAVALFTIVMVIGIGAVLNANLLHKKTQSVRAVIDNLGFVMEDISRNVRLGYDFTCEGVYPASYLPAIGSNPPSLSGTILGDPADCPNASNLYSSVSFTPTNIDPAFTGVRRIAYVITPVGIFKKDTPDISINTGQFKLLTPPEVTINASQSGFMVLGSQKADKVQPRVVMRLSGFVTYKNQQTPFVLHTTISPRYRDDPEI